VFDRADFSERKIFDVTLDDSTTESWLALVRPAAVREGRLGRLRSFMKHEAKVFAALQDLVHERAPAFVNLLADRTRLDARSVATALGTFHIAVSRAPITAMMEHLAADESAALHTGAQIPKAAEVTAPRTPETPTNTVLVGADKPSESLKPRRGRPPKASAPKPPPIEKVAASGPAAMPSEAEGQSARRTVPKGPMRPGETGVRPSFLIAGSRRYPVKSWKTLCVATFAWLAKNRAKQYQAVFDHPDLQGRTRNPVTRTPEGMLLASAVPGGYVDTNVSATNMITLINRVINVVDPSLDLDWC
jgi:hypothetical protein